MQTPPQAKHGDDIRAIRRLAAAWRSCWVTGDADALLSLWSEKPVLMPQGQRPVTSKRTLRRMYRSVLGSHTFRSTSRLKEVHAFGDWGYFWSTYALAASPVGGGRPVRSKGKSVFIVKRDRSGEWKIARLIDNSS